MESKTFRPMLNQEIANNMASSPTSSFGLADQIYKQLKIESYVSGIGGESINGKWYKFRY